MRINRQKVIERLKNGEKLEESGNTMMFSNGDSCTGATEIYLRENGLVEITGGTGRQVYSWPTQIVQALKPEDETEWAKSWLGFLEFCRVNGYVVSFENWGQWKQGHLLAQKKSPQPGELISDEEIAEEHKIEDMDNYSKASRYLIAKAMESGDGFMLRAIKTLMDALSPILELGYKSPEEVKELVERETERIWARLEEIDQLALDHKDFVRRTCNLIVELKPEALKGEK